jgi:hypothetical protein
LENLPKSTEWSNFKQMLTMTGKTESTNELLSHLLTFEAQLKREKGLPSDSALFVTRRQREKAIMSKITCFGCGVKGHKKEDCYRHDKWEAYKAVREADRRGEDSVNTVAAEPTDSNLTQLFAIYPVLSTSPTLNVLSTSPTLDASSRTVDTGATSHITGERSSITSDYMAYAPGEHQAKMANGTVVDAAGIGTAAIHKAETTTGLQQLLYVPACGKNQLISVSQLLLKGATLTLDMAKGAITRRGNVHIVTVPMTEGLFVLRANTSSKPTANTSTTMPKRTSYIRSGANLATVAKDRTAMREQMAGARDTQMEGARSTQLGENSARGTQKAGARSMQIAGARSTQGEDSARGTQNAGAKSMPIAGARSTQMKSARGTQNAGARSMQIVGARSTQMISEHGTQKAGAESMQIAGARSTEMADSARCTQNAGAESIQTAGARSTEMEDSARCTQKAGADSMQLAGAHRTQMEGARCAQAFMAAMSMSSEKTSLEEHHAFKFIAEALAARGAKHHPWKHWDVAGTVL